MSQESILKSVNALATKAKQAFDGPAYQADDAYDDIINCILNIISTEEALPETEAEILNILDELMTYKGLGIYANHKFSPISSSVAARLGIRRGDFISGNKFLVICEDDIASDYRPDRWGDARLLTNEGSYVHISSWCKRNPSMIAKLTKDTVVKLGLEETLNDFVNYGE